jgi:hypothetical protein
MFCENPKKAIKKHPIARQFFIPMWVVVFISFWGKKGK